MDLYKLFLEKKALLEGHFKLSSGLHSNKYFQCALLTAEPEIAEMLCETLAQKLRADKIEANLVIGPAIGGIILAYEMARALKVKAFFAEREEGQMRLRRGFTLKPDDKVLVVEDVVTTGGSTREVMDLVQSMGGEVVAVASLVDRSGGKVDFGVPFYPLLKVNVETYSPENCPLCAEGIPVVKPGSRK
ncbi:orotate phosphoribosyltransferase [Carboxydothermus islandicus]|uniref:Orotate phosphoribosyltransferase n=1 Tax=Carboxydothermus islandicus TaxID=661089 RepID=A0A1L8D1P9_9THEO|nr:orotate phosphoribosyltransferase [Carboxydothermus islandicus]GAV25037.1 orotate phosphoribosyltransferase [Carboxydothermus islandicus]